MDCGVLGGGHTRQRGFSDCERLNSDEKCFAILFGLFVFFFTKII